jgi:hypothetical protein
MTPPPAARYLESARSGIRRALAGWDAADLRRVEESCRLLTGAAADLRAFESAVRAGQILATPELCVTLLAAKDEVVRATRVVDACVAFHRGLAARTGAGSPIYNAEGCVAEEPAALESEVHA